MTESFLEVKNLKTHLFTRYGTVKAVDGVSFTVKRGETLGIVGESGSGKSITCRSLLRLVPYPAGKIVEGEILLEGKDLLQMSEDEMRKIRGGKISMILQDPMTSLNPVFRIEKQLTEGISIHTPLKKKAIWERACELMKLVRIPDQGMRLKDFPHQLSGGMKMRLSLARSLVLDPEYILLDEPLSAVDELTREVLQEELYDMWKKNKFTAILVTHNIAEAVYLSNRVVIMSPRPGKITDIVNIGSSLGFKERTPDIRTTSKFSKVVNEIAGKLRTWK